MSPNHFRNIFELRQKYSVGHEFYYSCLTTDFEWFEKKFSIVYLIEPIHLHISTQTIIPSNIDINDKFIITTLNTDKIIIRKYIMYIQLANMYDINFIVYESIDKSVLVIHESNFLLDTDLDEINVDFIRLVINTQREIENFNDSDTFIVKDENYELFKRIYTNALNVYPEEIIKIHDKNV